MIWKRRAVMIVRLLLHLAVFTTAGIASAGPDEATREIGAGIEAEQRMEPEVALVHFQAALERRPDDAFLQQKVAQQLSDLAFLETDGNRRRRLVEQAFGHAERAVEIEPSSPVAQLSLAVLYGRAALNVGAAERVEYARGIHERASRALELDAGYAWAHHVLGRWHVELSGLNFAKRAIVSLFLGGLPEASLSEGVRHLEQAVALEPDCLAHHVELGFAYWRAGREADARASWKVALSLPATRVFDPVAKQRASDALAEHTGRAERR